MRKLPGDFQEKRLPNDYFRAEESLSPPSTWVMAGMSSGSEVRQPKRDLLLEGSLTTTLDLPPSLTVVERPELDVMIGPSLETSHTGPAETVLGRMVVPGGQAPAAPAVGVP